MLTQEKVVTIKVLKQQGKSIKRIARETGLARNTIKKYLQRTDTKPVYQRKLIVQANWSHLKTIFSLGLMRLILIGYRHPFFMKKFLLWDIKENVEY